MVTMMSLTVVMAVEVMESKLETGAEEVVTRTQVVGTVVETLTVERVVKMGMVKATVLTTVA